MLGALQAGLLGVSGNVGDPSLLFRNGEVGVWLEPRLNTLFQDDAGTTAVTTTGQPVGKWLDLSGNNLHATQATAGNKPTYEVDVQGVPYIRFDGSNDYMTFGSLGAGLLRSIWFVGYLRNTGTVVIILESSANASNNSGAFYIDREYGTPQSLSILGNKANGSNLNIAHSNGEQISSLNTYRIEMDRQSSNDYTKQRKAWKNGNELTLTLTSAYTTSVRNTPFYDGYHYLGARNGGLAASEINLYGLILVNQIHSDAVKSAVDRYWMEKTT